MSIYIVMVFLMRLARTMKLLMESANHLVFVKTAPPTKRLVVDQIRTATQSLTFNLLVCNKI